MFCSKCGRESADSAKFCVKCGQPLSADRQQSEPQSVIKNTNGSGNAMDWLKENVFKRRHFWLTLLIPICFSIVLFVIEKDLQNKANAAYSSYSELWETQLGKTASALGNLFDAISGKTIFQEIGEIVDTAVMEQVYMNYNYFKEARPWISLILFLLHFIFYLAYIKMRSKKGAVIIAAGLGVAFFIALVYFNWLKPTLDAIRQLQEETQISEQSSKTSDTQ
jgi:hypothetical protein